MKKKTADLIKGDIISVNNTKIYVTEIKKHETVSAIYFEEYQKSSTAGLTWINNDKSIDYYGNEVG